MASLSNSLKCFVLACIFMQAVSASNQMVIYWGQNSAGSFTNVKSQWEQPLRNYCQDSSYDIIVVGFVYLFPSASGNSDPTMPGMNFANHCEVPFNDANPFVLNCTANIAPDITYCQQRGKKIILSFGGGVGNYGFSSDAQAVTFANTVWNMFLGGSGSIRPFGTAIFDGIDLDIEGGTQTGYISFIKTLRNYFASSGRTYYITAAPQCFYPDRLGPGAGTPLTEAWFDYIWIQFYNNHCGIDEPANFNFAKWATAMANAANPNVKLFIGAPASSTAAASGFISLAALQTLHTTIANTYSNIYGGMMLWDASTSDLNGNFGAKVGAMVHSGGSVTPTPVPTPTTPATTGAIKTMPATTGAALPITTGAVKSMPATTGRVSVPASLTTGAKSMPTTPSTTGAASMPTSTSGAATGACTVGHMQCLEDISDAAFSTCAHGNWPTDAVQYCGAGTKCQQTGNVIYCVASGSPTTPTTPTPTTPTTPTQPSTTGAVKQTSTSGDVKTSSTGSVNTGKCTLGHQQCVGSAGTNLYQTCGNAGWAAPQKCQAGLTCHQSMTGNNIYCY